MSERLKRAIARLKESQARQKKAADAHRQDATFKEGDFVLLSTKNISLKTPGAKKLQPKYIGPFPIDARIGKVAYRLKLPAGYRIHPVFHVSLLKPYLSKGVYQPPPPQFLDDGGNAYWTVQAIIDHRDRKVGNHLVRDFLVKWDGFGPEHNTWEPEKNLREDSLVEALVEQYLDGLANRPTPVPAHKPRPRSRRPRTQPDPTVRRLRVAPEDGSLQKGGSVSLQGKEVTLTFVLTR
jgi:hypothetical protein